jgi:hypothetical protein
MTPTTNNRFGRWLRPSPAMLVAVVALLASTAGISYAAVQVTGTNVKDASLTGRDVKNGTVTGKDVKNGTLGAKKLSKAAIGSLKGQPGVAGLQGPAGPQGPKGDSGVQGVQGPKGDTGVAQVTTRTGGIAFAADGFIGDKDQAVMCLPGETVVGGGYGLPEDLINTGPGTYVPAFAALQSRPANAAGNPAVNGQQPRGWYVKAFQGKDLAGAVAINVLCASA